MEQPPGFVTSALVLALMGGSLYVWLSIVGRLLARRPLAEYEPRAPVPWNGLDLAVLGVAALALQSLFVLAVSQGAAVEPAIPSAPATAAVVEPDVPSIPVMAAVVASRLVWFFFALIYLVRVTGAYADDMGFDLRRLKSDLRLAGATFLAAVLPVYGTQYVLTQVFHFESKHPLVSLTEDHSSAGVLLLATAMAVIAAPLVEEFLLRVLLQGWLEKKVIEARLRRGRSPDQPAGFAPIAVAGAIFAALHAWPDGVALFVLSLFVGWAYQRTHRIVAPLTVHFCVNALAMFEMWRQFLAQS